MDSPLDKVLTDARDTLNDAVGSVTDKDEQVRHYEPDWYASLARDDDPETPPVIAGDLHDDDATVLDSLTQEHSDPIEPQDLPLGPSGEGTVTAKATTVARLRSQRVPLARDIDGNAYPAMILAPNASRKQLILRASTFGGVIVGESRDALGSGFELTGDAAMRIELSGYTGALWAVLAIGNNNASIYSLEVLG